MSHSFSSEEACWGSHRFLAFLDFGEQFKDGLFKKSSSFSPSKSLISLGNSPCSDTNPNCCCLNHLQPGGCGASLPQRIRTAAWPWNVRNTGSSWSRSDRMGDLNPDPAISKISLRGICLIYIHIYIHMYVYVWWIGFWDLSLWELNMDQILVKHLNWTFKTKIINGMNMAYSQLYRSWVHL